VIIHCPECSTGYLLPDHLVGGGGARVRCPRCQHLFAVGADGRPRELAPPPAPGAAPAERPLETVEEPAATPAAGVGAPAAGGAGHLEIARAVLHQVAEDGGEAMARAHAERRLFADFGPALMDAWETYRRHAGVDADPGAFREALRERWGVELVPLRAREA
jgi:predicted Zn finger-like uncharacterized protein